MRRLPRDMQCCMTNFYAFDTQMTLNCLKIERMGCCGLAKIHTFDCRSCWQTALTSVLSAATMISVKRCVCYARGARKVQRVSRHRALATAAGKDRRGVVTGIGLVTPLATGTQQTWQRLIAGQTAVAAITDPAIAKLDLPAKVAARVKRSSAKSGGGIAASEFDAEEWVPRALSTTASPFIQFAMRLATSNPPHRVFCFRCQCCVSSAG